LKLVVIDRLAGRELRRILLVNLLGSLPPATFGLAYALLRGRRIRPITRTTDSTRRAMLTVSVFALT